MQTIAASTLPVSPPTGASPALVALEASMKSQAELVESLLSVSIQNEISTQKMETAARIIDVYA